MGKNTQSQKAGNGSVLKSPVIREFSSGGVVYKKEADKTLWLVTASNPSDLYPKVYWRLPKGWLDNDSIDVPGPMASGKVKAGENSLQEAALREVSEEGGVKAEIVGKIGTSKYIYHNYSRGDVFKFVTFYLMKWLSDLDEGFDGETSEVLWLPYEEARKKLSFSSEKEMLDKAKEFLASLAYDKNAKTRLRRS